MLMFLAPIFSEDWYGILYSWADSKKKSSLMLSLFEPGKFIPGLDVMKLFSSSIQLRA